MTRVYIDYSKLKYMCKKNDITLIRLSIMLKVARQTIYRWCMEGTDRSNLLLLADVLNCKENELI